MSVAPARTAEGPGAVVFCPPNRFTTGLRWDDAAAANASRLKNLQKKLLAMFAPRHGFRRTLRWPCRDLGGRHVRAVQPEHTVICRDRSGGTVGRVPDHRWCFAVLKRSRAWPAQANSVRTRRRDCATDWRVDGEVEWQSTGAAARIRCFTVVDARAMRRKSARGRNSVRRHSA